jgi:hypothetical protein
LFMGQFYTRGDRKARKIFTLVDFFSSNFLRVMLYIRINSGDRWA